MWTSPLCPTFILPLYAFALLQVSTSSFIKSLNVRGDPVLFSLFRHCPPPPPCTSCCNNYIVIIIAGLRALTYLGRLKWNRSQKFISCFDANRLLDGCSSGNKGNPEAEQNALISWLSRLIFVVKCKTLSLCVQDIICSGINVGFSDRTWPMMVYHTISWRE